MKSFAVWSILALAFASGCSSEKTLDKLTYAELSVLLDAENAELDRRQDGMNSIAFAGEQHKNQVQFWLNQIARRNTIAKLRVKAWDRESQLIQADEPETYEHYMESEKEALKAIKK